MLGRPSLLIPIAAALVSAALLSACQPKAVEGASQVVDGMRFEYGLAPSDQVAAHPANHVESTMHRGPLNAPNAYHITLALFDAKTGSRITDAQVSYEISGPGHPGVGEMPMDQMTINGDVTYGAYEVLPSTAQYRLTFIAKRYGPPSTTSRAAFSVERPGGP